MDFYKHLELCTKPYHDKNHSVNYIFAKITEVTKKITTVTVYFVELHFDKTVHIILGFMFIDFLTCKTVGSSLYYFYTKWEKRFDKHHPF